jgi:hypothetical protein
MTAKLSESEEAYTGKPGIEHTVRRGILGFKQDRILDDLELSLEEKTECSKRLCHICIHWKALKHKRKPIKMEDSTAYASQVEFYCESGFVRYNFYCRCFETNRDLLSSMVINSSLDAVLLHKIQTVLRSKD